MKGSCGESLEGYRGGKEVEGGRGVGQKKGKSQLICEVLELMIVGGASTIGAGRLQQGQRESSGTGVGGVPSMCELQVRL